MRNLIILAALLIGAGAYMAQVADEMTTTAAARPTTSTQPTAFAALQDNTQAGIRSISIARDGRGHFQTEGRIDSQRIGFMVDTGASVVALNASSAARLGVWPSQNDYTTTVTTANGKLKAARTRLAMIDIGGLIVRDVDAMVLPDEALSENLLGISFLSKLKRFEFANGRMMLEQ